jgi:hypothetical protein
MADTTKKDTDGIGGTNWHAWQAPLAEPEKGSGEATEVDEKGKDCEVCGQGADALVHQVDDSGNPTPEAQHEAETGHKA